VERGEGERRSNIKGSSELREDQRGEKGGERGEIGGGRHIQVSCAFSK
jgi:hypothetical protein